MGKTPISFFTSDAFTNGFPQEVLSPELESLSPQEHSLRLFDEHDCGFASVREWHTEALQAVYDERFIRLSRAVNMDIFSHNVSSYQHDYACVQLAEKQHTQWRHSRSMPPSRVLIAVQRGLHWASVADEHMRPDMPGIASCAMAQDVWRNLTEHGGDIPGGFFWLLNVMGGWDCDMVVDFDQALHADWVQEYDMVFTMSWFQDDDSKWSFHCEDDDWTNPWLSLQKHRLQQHSPVVFIVPHEPERYCGAVHVPPTAPHCPVFLDNYGCMDQPPRYWQQPNPEDKKGPRSLSTVVSYHYNVTRVQERWYSNTVRKSVLFTANKRQPEPQAMFRWLVDHGFDVDSANRAFCYPQGTCTGTKHDSSKSQSMDKMAVQKYAILQTMDRQSSGQLVAEMSMLGVPTFITGGKLFHRLLQHPFLLCVDLEEIQRKILFFEANPHAYEQVRAYIARRLPFIDITHLPQPYHLAARAQTVLRNSLQQHRVDLFKVPFVDNTTFDEYSRLCSIRTHDV